MTDDSATISLDLANDFPEAEEIQTRNKEPTPKNIQAEDSVTAGTSPENLIFFIPTEFVYFQSVIDTIPL